MLSKDDLWTIDECLRAKGVDEPTITIVQQHVYDVLIALELDDTYDARRSEV